MVNVTVTRGMLAGSNANDTLTGIAQNGLGQIHVYAKAGNDTINLDFAKITKFSHGHHARGDGDGSSGRGSDTFNFRNIENIERGQVVVGRIEDFDARDTIKIQGTTIDLNNLGSTNYNVRVVEFNDGHNDTGQTPQQWILIENSKGGKIFYSLEGARVDENGNGGASGGGQENHFLLASQLPDFSNLKNVDFVDPKNYVPAGEIAQGGLVINDDDDSGSDTDATIMGSSKGDLIAAGLNNDSVNAGSGNDKIWGGSGHDTIKAGTGNDTIEGGTGNDILYGGSGADVFVFDTESGNDTIRDFEVGIDTFVFRGDEVDLGAITKSYSGFFGSVSFTINSMYSDGPIARRFGDDLHVRMDRGESRVVIEDYFENYIPDPEPTTGGKL